MSERTTPYTEAGTDYVNKNQNKKERTSKVFFRIFNISLLFTKTFTLKV